MIRVELEGLHCNQGLKEQQRDNGPELEELHCGHRKLSVSAGL